MEKTNDYIVTLRQIETRLEQIGDWLDFQHAYMRGLRGFRNRAKYEKAAQKYAEVRLEQQAIGILRLCYRSAVAEGPCGGFSA